jgi:sulfate/thiosulfate transport system substrate-binding protein
MLRMRVLGAILVLVCAGTVAAAAISNAPAAPSATGLTLVAYSTPREAYAKLTAAFGKTGPGEDVELEQSYGSSGEQARAVLSGLRADIVALSLEPDVTTLVKGGLVPANWNRDAYKGMVTRSVVVLAVRDGNPKKIRDWNDLIKPGVEIVTPNVQTSGGARWNIMAAYGAQIRAKKTHKQAVDYLREFYRHVVSQDKSAREALQTFLAGRGDVLLAYENEAIFANQKGQKVQYVIPKATIRIENPIALTNAGRSKPEARAFLRFLRTKPAQRIFAENGYRPVLASATKGFSFPVRPQLFTIDYLGGWKKVQPRFFHPRTGIVTKIQAEAGN